MAVNIDWGLASTPNILGAYAGARDKAQANVLAQQQVQAQAQQRQVENQRADTRLGMDQAKETREQSAADAASWQHAAQAVGHLKGVLGTGGPEAALAAFHDIAPGLGLTPEATAQMEGALTKNPQGFLDSVGALAEKKLQFISTGNGGVAVGDQNTGQISQAIQPTYEQEYAVVPEGGKLIPKPRPGAPTAATPVAGGDGSGGSVPRNMRNNNPGNIEDGPFAQSLPGYKGSDGRFAIFDDPKAGGQAQVALLGSYGRRGINTVEGAINRWAPASDGNDTAAYTKFVSDKVGVKPGQKIDLTDPVIASDVASAIQQFEGGEQSKSNAAAAPQAQPGDPAGTIYGAPKPTTRPATAEEKAAYGIPAGVPAQMKPDGSIDPITVGNGRGTGKLSPQDSKYISEARTSSQTLANTLPLVNRFIKLNEDIGTGGLMANGALAQGRAMFDPKVAEMKSITDKLTPAMRQGLPGAASDRDIAMFQSATVGVGKPGPANQSVAVALQAAVKRQQDYVAYLENYAKQNGSLLGAQEDWDAYAAANPMFSDEGKGSLKANKTTPWREYFGEPAPQHQGRAAPAASTAKPAAGQLPAQAISQLQEGHATTFGNGQIWTKEGGKPKRLR